MPEVGEAPPEVLKPPLNHTPLDIEALSQPRLTASEIVERQLAPTSETDQAGHDRRVYQYKDLSFSFRGREELPIHNSLQSKKVEALVPDEIPNWTDAKTHQDYLKQLETSAGQETHLLTNKTVRGVLELAVRLGGSEDLRKLSQEVAQGKYSQETLSIIDRIVAATVIDDEGKVSEQPIQDAEALVTLALLGDQTAKTVVEAKVKQLDSRYEEREAERQREVREHNEKYRGDVDAVDPKELIAVHATKYKPEILPDGSLAIRTTLDATGGQLFRNSIHFSLNHLVEGHLWGDWGDKAYVVLAPVDKMIDANGLPRLLEGVDTWWVQNPGEKLVLPGASIIPGGDKEAVVKVIAEKGYRYLAGGPHYITDGKMQARISKYGSEKGIIPGGLHQNTDESRLEDAVFKQIGRGREFRDGDFVEDGEFYWEKLNPPEYITTILSLLAPENRRAFYATGILVSHPEPEKIYTGPTI